MIDLLASLCAHAIANKRTCRVSIFASASLLRAFDRVCNYAARRVRASVLQQMLHLDIDKFHIQEKDDRLSLG